MLKTGVLIVNLGTPDSTKVFDVAKYLRQFLMDGRVIDINPIGRSLLVHGIIAPFRSFKSAKEYKKLWTKEGSPLLTYGKKLETLLQDSLGDKFIVRLAMRYQSPSIEHVMAEMSKMGLEKLIVIPLFPQYASATVGSANERVLRELQKWYIIPELRMVSQYHHRQDYINCWKEIGSKPEYDYSMYDKVLFSFHGVPVRQLDKGYIGSMCEDHNCEHGLEDSGENLYCYKASCYDTAKSIATELGIPEDKYMVVFQSRLGKAEWTRPYAEPTIRELAQNGVKSILMYSPAFVADCLETTVELGMEYKEVFQEEGGETLDLVESLNDHPKWVECLKNITTEL